MNFIELAVDMRTLSSVQAEQDRTEGKMKEGRSLEVIFPVGFSLSLLATMLMDNYSLNRLIDEWIN